MTWKLFQEREVIFLDDVLSLIAVVEVVLTLSFLLITKDKDLYPKLDLRCRTQKVKTLSLLTPSKDSQNVFFVCFCFQNRFDSR